MPAIAGILDAIDAFMTSPERKRRPIRFITANVTPTLIPMRSPFVLIVLLACSLSVQAQFPSKPLRAIVAFGTGGATDEETKGVELELPRRIGTKSFCLLTPRELPPPVVPT